jgi:hypothetical protein
MAMKSILVALVLMLVVLTATPALAGWGYAVYGGYWAAPVYAYPAPVMVPAPVVAAPTYAYPAVVPAPVFVRPRYLPYGQPIRNVVRVVVP